MNQSKKPLLSSRLIVSFLGRIVAIVAMVDKKELVDQNEDIESPDCAILDNREPKFIK